MENDNKNKDSVENSIPDNVSPVRFIMDEISQDKLININDLETAREIKDAVLIMEGDWGGQIYLTCPVKYVMATEDCLFQLLNDLDDLAWGDQGEHSRKILFEVRKIGEGIWGGMGGGLISEGLWTHDEFEDIKDEINEIIKGKKSRINK